MKPAALAAALAALLLPASAGAAGLRFSEPAQLPHGDPKASGFMAGGEPSLAFDPAGDGHVYVTAPQGIPAAAGALLNGAPLQGVGFWASDDHGRTFPRSGVTGSALGGGDSDVEVLADHKLLVADLEAAAAAICTSTDFAATFPDCDGGLALNQQGPDNDREWLTRANKPGVVYLTYHDFVAGVPIIENSTDSGRSFTPCGLILDGKGPAAKTYSPLGGTLVSKPVVDAAENVYVEFTTPDSTALPLGARLNHLYMGVSKGPCSGKGDTTFSNYVIYENPGADLARIFQAEAIDGAGQLYVLAGGKISADSPEGMWLFTSTDKGRTWSAPIQVNPPDVKASVFPAIAGGPAKGEIAFTWLGTTTSGDPNTQANQWRYYAGESLDGGGTFAIAPVDKDPLHYGDVCTQGIFCGLIPGQPGNRNLADFASVAVDPQDGCPALALPGDPYNRPDQPDGADNGRSSAYYSRVTDAAGCLTKANSGQPASTISGVPGTTCVDKAAPRVRARKARRLRNGRLRISGTATDRGCGAKGRGRVRRVQVAVARRAGRRCRFVTRAGRLTKARSCRRPVLLKPRGRVRWTLTVKRPLPRGRYSVYVRASDRAGNRSAIRAVRLKA